MSSDRRLLELTKLQGIQQVTTQTHERTLLNDRQLSMTYSPDLPLDGSRVIELEQNNIELGCSAVSCRRYAGTWLIRGNRLYLADSLSQHHLEASNANEAMFAGWFTGNLTTKDGPIFIKDIGGHRKIGACVIVEKGIVANIDESFNELVNVPTFSQSHAWDWPPEVYNDYIDIISNYLCKEGSLSVLNDGLPTEEAFRDWDDEDDYCWKDTC